MKELARCTNTPEQDLLNAIVQQAAEEHRAAFVKLLRKPDDVRAKRLQKEAESFFLSEDFEIFTKVAGSYLLRKLREEEEEIVRNLEEFQKLRNAFYETWESFLFFAKQEDLEKTYALRISMEELLRHIPEAAQSLFVLTKREKNIFKRLKKWEEADEKRKAVRCS